MSVRRTHRAVFSASIALCAAALAAALISQHVFDMQPCPYCVMQRAIFVAIAIVALPAALLRAKAVQLACAALVAGFAAFGVFTALWHHFVAKSLQSCAMTWADRIIRGLGLDELLPPVFAAYASCADAAAKLLGVPYEFYSLALYLLIGAVALYVLKRTR